MAKKKSRKKSGDNRNLHAFITTFLSIVGFVLALLLWKNDKYVMYYAKQSLLVFVVFVIASVTSIIPVIGDIISVIVHIVGVILWVMSWIYALSGEMKPVPIVGEYAASMKL